MLILIDLDNTLLDRTSAFRRWAARYVSGLGGGPSDVDWLTAADRDGYEPRPRLAEAMRQRWGLSTDPAGIVEELMTGMLSELAPDPAVNAALRSAVAAGCVPVVVTNGTVRQQEAKLRITGLDRLVAGWVVSEAAAVRKPDPRIFRLAADSVGLPLTGGWMVGDHPELDVGGAAAVGLNTVWLRRGLDWPAALPYRPTRVADDCAEAVTGVLPSPAVPPTAPG